MTRAQFLDKLLHKIATEDRVYSPSLKTTISIDWGIRYIFSLYHISNGTKFTFHLDGNSFHFYSTIHYPGANIGRNYNGFIAHPNLNSLATAIWEWRQMR